MRDSYVLTETGGEFAGIGIKFASDSESTRLLNAEVTVRMRESGGRAVEESTDIEIRPTGAMIGIRTSSTTRSTWCRVITPSPADV